MKTAQIEMEPSFEHKSIESCYSLPTYSQQIKPYPVFFLGSAYEVFMEPPVLRNGKLGVLGELGHSQLMKAEKITKLII